jgi:hypothetical protein
VEDVATDELGSAPVVTGVSVVVELDPDAVGTSSRGAATQTAVKARTVTPSLVRVNK